MIKVIYYLVLFISLKISSLTSTDNNDLCGSRIFDCLNRRILMNFPPVHDPVPSMNTPVL